MIEDVLVPALGALRDMTAHRWRAAVRDVVEGAHVTRQHGIAVAFQVGRSVSPNDVGEPEHGAGGRATDRP